VVLRRRGQQGTVAGGVRHQGKKKKKKSGRKGLRVCSGGIYDVSTLGKDAHYRTRPACLNISSLLIRHSGGSVGKSSGVKNRKGKRCHSRGIFKRERGGGTPQDEKGFGKEVRGDLGAKQRSPTSQNQGGASSWGAVKERTGLLTRRGRGAV